MACACMNAGQPLDRAHEGLGAGKKGLEDANMTTAKTRSPPTGCVRTRSMRSLTAHGLRLLPGRPRSPRRPATRSGRRRSRGRVRGPLDGRGTKVREQPRRTASGTPTGCRRRARACTRGRRREARSGAYSVAIARRQEHSWRCPISSAAGWSRCFGCRRRVGNGARAPQRSASKPRRFVATTGTTGAPRERDRRSVSMRSPSRSAASIMLSATTTGTPDSMSCSAR